MLRRFIQLKRRLPRLKYMAYEGHFRRSRLWSNDELRKFAPLFTGSIVNVSAWRDMDKSINNYLNYIAGDFNSGINYKSYFKNASEYYLTNHPLDSDRGSSELLNNKISYSGTYDMDLEDDLPEHLMERFDVVFNHTVLEHVFDVFKAFENLCRMSKDVVIIILPWMQRLHDYHGDYKDYWRFSPFVIDKLFERNGYTVLHRSSSDIFQSSIYYFYIASRIPNKWVKNFRKISVDEDMKNLNIGSRLYPVSTLQMYFERILRKVASFIRKCLWSTKKAARRHG